MLFSQSEGSASTKERLFSAKPCLADESQASSPNGADNRQWPYQVVDTPVDFLETLLPSVEFTPVAPEKKLNSECPDSPPKIVGMAFVGLQQVWGVNRGVDRVLRGVSERIGNG